MDETQLLKLLAATRYISADPATIVEAETMRAGCDLLRHLLAASVAEADERPSPLRAVGQR